MESQYCTEDGVLLKNAIVEAALDMRPDLIKLLMSHDALKHNFFTEIEGVLVFDKVKFQRFVMNKRFLPDSYSSYKNKIRLTDDNGNFVSESREIVLTWPFKDCILEGGQTKEDAKRNEIFWNEILAPDEINRLTEPKALTNFAKYGKDGKSTKTSVSTNDNFIIKGNNLLVLYSLRKIYKGKIKLIYIDPPFNTGNDSFGYNDSFKHSTWMTFMKNRLEVAKELLSEDGSILVHLDWNEVHYCKVMMDEIFGRNCFINEIVWCYNGPGSPNMRQLNRKHDNILWYSKNPNKWTFNKEDIRMSSEVHVGGFNGEMTSDASEEYTQKGKVPEDWWTMYHTIDDLKEDLELLRSEDVSNADWFKAAVAARIRIDGERRTGYPTEKPYKLMERIIKMASNEGDIVLDFFCGSGTTGFSAYRLKRRFILAEQLSDTMEKLRFRFRNIPHVYCELATANQRFIDEITVAGSDEQLNRIWKDMQHTGFLSWKIEPKHIEEHATDFKSLSIEDKKRFLIECLDKNLLYVPLSEIDNAEFGISNEVKNLNSEFYITI